MSVERYEPTQLEVACGMVFGFTPPESLPEPAADPLEALEEAILPALQRAPCLVSFSGGRDSATVLAAAVRLARREGLELRYRPPTYSPASRPATRGGGRNGSSCTWG